MLKEADWLNSTEHHCSFQMNSLKTTDRGFFLELLLEQLLFFNVSWGGILLLLNQLKKAFF